MDLSPWAHGGVVQVRVASGRSPAGIRGPRVHCVLEIEYADGSTDFWNGGLATRAAFEAFVRDLNRALRAKRPH